MNMKHLIAAAALLGTLSLSAQEYNDIPYDWKWVGDHEVALTYDGSFTAEKDYSLDAKTHKKTLGISYPEPTSVFPVSAGRSREPYIFPGLFKDGFH
jgi:hypothetical protein